MANFPESGHLGAEYSEPSIMFKDLTPDVDPIRSRAGFTSEGLSVDDLLAEQRYSEHQEWLLTEAKKSVVTQFSKQTLAGTYWSIGYAAGFGLGGIGGSAAGYMAMVVAAGAVEQLTGIPITDAVNSVSPEVADFMTNAGEAVANGLSLLTDQLPPELAANTKQYISNFQSQVVATVTGVKLATFTGNKVGGMWYGPGDRLGESVGTKISSPLVKLHDRFPIRLPRFTLPRLVNRN
jgi:hypothetical protein